MGAAAAHGRCCRRISQEAAHRLGTLREGLREDGSWLGFADVVRAFELLAAEAPAHPDLGAELRRGCALRVFLLLDSVEPRLVLPLCALPEPQLARQLLEGPLPPGWQRYVRRHAVQIVTTLQSSRPGPSALHDRIMTL